MRGRSRLVHVALRAGPNQGLLQGKTDTSASASGNAKSGHKSRCARPKRWLQGHRHPSAFSSPLYDEGCQTRPRHTCINWSVISECRTRPTYRETPATASSEKCRSKMFKIRAAPSSFKMISLPGHRITFRRPQRRHLAPHAHLLLVMQKREAFHTGDCRGESWSRFLRQQTYNPAPASRPLYNSLKLRSDCPPPMWKNLRSL